MINDTVEVCLHFKFGYCRYEEKCKKKHIKEICSENDCSVAVCSKRHPRECRYFALYNRCKFGSYCNYAHKPSTETLLKSCETKIKYLEKVVNEVENEKLDLKCKVDNLAMKLEALEKELKKETIKDNSMKTINDSAIVEDLYYGNSSNMISPCLKCSNNDCVPPDKSILNEQGCDFCDSEFESLAEFIQNVKCVSYLCDDCQEFNQKQPWFI